MEYQTDVRKVTIWLTKLALLTSAGNTTVSKERLGLMATILADDFPPEVFSDKSLTEVAESMEFFPAYAALKSSLGKYLPIKRIEGPSAMAQAMPDWLKIRVLENSGGSLGPMTRQAIGMPPEDVRSVEEQLKILRG